MTKLDRMIEDWKSALLTNLENPPTKERVQKILPSEQRQLIQQFLEARALPEPIDNKFLEAVNRRSPIWCCGL